MPTLANVDFGLGDSDGGSAPEAVAISRTEPTPQAQLVVHR